MKRASLTLLLCALAAVAVLAIFMALSIGSAISDPVEFWRAALADEHSLARTLALELRLPRALLAFTIGAMLALAGVLMQVLLRNPLADPYILGISGGASVAALAAMLAGLAGWWIEIGAALGALAATALVFTLAHGSGAWTPTRLLLTGVVIAAGCGAMVSLMLALGPESRLRGMVFWLIGDLSHTGAPLRLALVLIPILIASLLAARHLNLLARGDLEAQMLGLPVRSVRYAIFIAASLLTATAVSSAGSIGFVGLVTPHLVRQMSGSDHRVVVPAAALLGGTILVLADLLARTLIAPRQLPVGALTALIGVPLFLALIRRQRLVS